MFFERPKEGLKAIVVHSVIESLIDEKRSEFSELILAAGLSPVLVLKNLRQFADPRFFLGKGKVEEINLWLKKNTCDVIVLEDSLTPSQERNLERHLKKRVIGRTGLILDIFAKRARTHEGKLQVELAKLKHESSRLVGGWTHLDRQRRGFGSGAISGSGVGGAGETQLEADQRILSGRIKHISRQLEKVISQRRQNRRFRAKSEIKIIALAGYTNAGKSTLFNMICEEGVLVRDQLFATLDTTIRRMKLPFVGESLLVDTVGFIKALPPELVAAFKATLEEVAKADLILHVVDSSSEDKLKKVSDVNKILADIGASHIPQLMIYNKRDVRKKSFKVDRDKSGLVKKIWTTSLNSTDRESLLEAIAERVADNLVTKKFNLSPHQAKIRADLYSMSSVVDEEFLSDGSSNLVVRGERSKLIKVLA